MQEKKQGHWSDCALHNKPAYPAGECDCGGLDLAAYDRYIAVTALIPSPGSLAAFVKDGILPSPIEAEQSPRAGVAALAPAPDLPSAHNRVAIVGGPDSVDFDHAGEAPVSDGKALPGVQSITSDVPPHGLPPESPKKLGDTGGAA